jgi:hypothetical protein
MFRTIFGKPKEPSKPIPTTPKPKYVAPYILNKFPVLKEAVEAAENEPRENYDVIRELEMSAAEKLGEVWKTARDLDKKMLLDRLPYRIVWEAQAYYGVPGGHTTAAEHGGRRRKTKKSKRRARKTCRSV